MDIKNNEIMEVLEENNTIILRCFKSQLEYNSLEEMEDFLQI